MKINTVHISKMTGKWYTCQPLIPIRSPMNFVFDSTDTDTICFECYSFEMLQGYRKSCAPAFQRNCVALSSLIDYDDLPICNYAVLSV